jgi:glycosyltransferase involved in cell wall biosynthesis
VRVCLVYDHFFPQTVGGTERWMRDLGSSLARLGHEVTFLTMRHWDRDSTPSLPGVRVLGLVDPGRVYRPDRRAFGPPLRFGLAVGRHLLRHGRQYDVVHTAAFPYFPLLAAGACRRRGGYSIVVDWHEVWTAKYWRHYAGTLVTASEREGYGLVVVEAAAHGTPSVVVAGPENAATELVSEGVNGTIALNAGPEELGAAILRVLDGGAALRSSTARWFEENADRLRLDRSLEVVLAEYAAGEANGARAVTEEHRSWPPRPLPCRAADPRPARRGFVLEPTMTDEARTNLPCRGGRPPR